jgi:hypothetical protein
MIQVIALILCAAGHSGSIAGPVVLPTFRAAGLLPAGCPALPAVTWAALPARGAADVLRCRSTPGPVALHSRSPLGPRCRPAVLPTCRAAGQSLGKHCRPRGAAGQDRPRAPRQVGCIGCGGFAGCAGVRPPFPNRGARRSRLNRGKTAFKDRVWRAGAICSPSGPLLPIRPAIRLAGFNWQSELGAPTG